MTVERLDEGSMRGMHVHLFPERWDALFQLAMDKVREIEPDYYGGAMKNAEFWTKCKGGVWEVVTRNGNPFNHGYRISGVTYADYKDIKKP